MSVYQTEKIKNPTIKVDKRSNTCHTHALCWFSINGKLTFPAIDICKSNDGNTYYTIWRGNNCKSFNGLGEIKKYLIDNITKRIFNDGSWCYKYNI